MDVGVQSDVHIYYFIPRKTLLVRVSPVTVASRTFHDADGKAGGSLLTLITPSDCAAPRLKRLVT